MGKTVYEVLFLGDGILRLARGGRIFGCFFRLSMVFLLFWLVTGGPVFIVCALIAAAIVALLNIDFIVLDRNNGIGSRWSILNRYPELFVHEIRVRKSSDCRYGSPVFDVELCFTGGGSHCFRVWDGRKGSRDPDGVFRFLGGWGMGQADPSGEAGQ